MKKYLLLVLVVFLCMFDVSAQVNKKPVKKLHLNTPKVNKLHDKGRAKPSYSSSTIGFYGAVYGAYMRIPMKNYDNFPNEMKNPDAIEYGVNAACLVRPWLGVGLAFSAFDNKFTSKWLVEPASEKRDYLNGYYGGIFIEPTVAHRHPIHVAFPVILGYGKMTDHKFYKYMVSVPGFSGLETTSEKVQSSFVMIEPGAEVEFNATSFMRVGAGAKFRITSGVNTNDNFWLLNYPTSLLNGVTYNLSVKFGKF